MVSASETLLKNKKRCRVKKSLIIVTCCAVCLGIWNVCSIIHASNKIHLSYLEAHYGEDQIPISELKLDTKDYDNSVIQFPTSGSKLDDDLNLITTEKALHPNISTQTDLVDNLKLHSIANVLNSETGKTDGNDTVTISESEVFDGSKMNTTITAAFAPNKETNMNNKISSVQRKSALLVAIYPTNQDRLTALWSQLECYCSKNMFKTIVIAAPEWAGNTTKLEQFIFRATTSIPHLKEGDTKVIVKYYKNDRYDVGLWCDAAGEKYHGSDNETKSIFETHDDFVLINDSIMALENFTGVLDALHENNLSMTSLHWWDKSGEPYWLESVFRAFSKRGMAQYMEHSCNVQMFEKCNRNKFLIRGKKRCIVDRFEVAIAALFPRTETMGIFPGYIPKEIRDNKHGSWSQQTTYLKKLRDEHRLPAIKISNPEIFRITRNLFKSDIGNCTVHLNPQWLTSFPPGMGVEYEEMRTKLRREEKKELRERRRQKRRKS